MFGGGGVLFAWRANRLGLARLAPCLGRGWPFFHFFPMRTYSDRRRADTAGVLFPQPLLDASDAVDTPNVECPPCFVNKSPGFNFNKASILRSARHTP